MEPTEPVTAHGRVTRDRIVAAASELVMRHGVAATSLDDVRGRARVSKGQLYHYFTDRDDLMRAVARSLGETIVGHQAAEWFPRLDTIDGIRAWADRMVDMQRELGARGGCPMGSLGGQLVEHNEAARRELVDAFARWETGIREGLERMRDRGELRPDAEPAVLAQRTLAAVQGGLLLTQIRRDPDQLRTAIDGAIDAIIAARPGAPRRAGPGAS